MRLKYALILLPLLYASQALASGFFSGGTSPGGGAGDIQYYSNGAFAGVDIDSNSYVTGGATPSGVSKGRIFQSVRSSTNTSTGTSNTTYTATASSLTITNVGAGREIWVYAAGVLHALTSGFSSYATIKNMTTGEDLKNRGIPTPSNGGLCEATDSATSASINVSCFMLAVDTAPAQGTNLYNVQIYTNSGGADWSGNNSTISYMYAEEKGRQ